ncbi:MAG: winged helix-turn-helix transcriptional regulator [Gemmatimonadota bacterium]
MAVGTSPGGCGCAAPGTRGETLCCCTADELVHTIGRKYAMPILNCVGSGRGVRFTELQEALDVSSSVLSETLDDLQRVGLLSRSALGDAAGRSEYALTAAGETLRQSLRRLLDHLREVQ